MLTDIPFRGKAAQSFGRRMAVWLTLLLLAISYTAPVVAQCHKSSSVNASCCIGSMKMSAEASNSMQPAHCEPATQQDAATASSRCEAASDLALPDLFVTAQQSLNRFAVRGHLDAFSISLEPVVDTVGDRIQSAAFVRHSSQRFWSLDSISPVLRV
jgi:hypothetical protein